MWFGITLILGIILWYAITGRRWLKTKSWAQGYFNFVEPIEIALYRKSETILVGRLLWLGGSIVTLYDTAAVSFSSLDLTPLTSRVLAKVPEDMRGLVVSASFAALGLLMNWLRKQVSQPIEITALANKDITPKIAEAVAMADATKTEAVAAVVQGKGA